MKNLAIKEKAADYLARFPKKKLSNEDYEKFIRTCYSVSPPPKKKLEEILRYAPKVKFRLS
jgi:hypothetical protein